MWIKYFIFEFQNHDGFNSVRLLLLLLWMRYRYHSKSVFFFAFIKLEYSMKFGSFLSIHSCLKCGNNVLWSFDRHSVFAILLKTQRIHLSVIYSSQMSSFVFVSFIHSVSLFRRKLVQGHELFNALHVLRSQNLNMVFVIIFGWWRTSVRLKIATASLSQRHTNMYILDA